MGKRNNLIAHYIEDTQKREVIQMCSLTWVLVLSVAIAQIVLYLTLRRDPTDSTILHDSTIRLDNKNTTSKWCPSLCTCDMFSVICTETDIIEFPSSPVMSVQQLVVDNNGFTKIPKDLSMRFPKLTDFSMMGNKIPVLVLETFAGFNEVSQDLVVVLSWNEITTIIPSEMVVEKLGYIDLTGNRLEYISNNVFENCPNLKMICLSRNPLQLPANLPFLSSSSLKLLYLANIDASLLSEKTFSELPSLTELTLSNSKVHDITKAFASLGSLTYLHLKNNSISEVKVSSFSPHSKLFMLDLDGNPLKDLDPADLPVEADGTISIMNTPFTCSCAHEKIISWAAKEYIFLRDNCTDTLCGSGNKTLL
ncbi:Protein artichoke [Gryllus bimaculatus]|nr:Protein artichoke [Gryllus bimaculatus]